VTRARVTDVRSASGEELTVLVEDALVVGRKAVRYDPTVGSRRLGAPDEGAEGGRGPRDP
jgi:hypothetical protein